MEIQIAPQHRARTMTVDIDCHREWLPKNVRSVRAPIQVQTTRAPHALINAAHPDVPECVWPRVHQCCGRFQDRDSRVLNYTNSRVAYRHCVDRLQSSSDCAWCWHNRRRTPMSCQTRANLDDSIT